MMFQDRTRQTGTRLADIRRDHVNRYCLAVRMLPWGARVVDVGCGVGYGTRILFDAGFDVTGFDVAPEAVSQAERDFPGPRYEVRDAMAGGVVADAAVAFEVIEHIPRPDLLLAGLDCSMVIASVPNEAHYPFVAENFRHDRYPHLRHYLPDAFDALFAAHGFRPTHRFCQRDKDPGRIEFGNAGRFMINVYVRT